MRRLQRCERRIGVACRRTRVAALPHLRPSGRKVEIPSLSGRYVGVLRLPDGDGPHPAVVMVPGLDSAKEEFRSTEALFLDPTYTSKAMAGLIARLRSGEFNASGTVLFWHTGGQVGLFR